MSLELPDALHPDLPGELTLDGLTVPVAATRRRSLVELVALAMLIATLQLVVFGSAWGGLFTTALMVFLAPLPALFLKGDPDTLVVRPQELVALRLGVPVWTVPLREVRWVRWEALGMQIQTDSELLRVASEGWRTRARSRVAFTRFVHDTARRLRQHEPDPGATDPALESLLERPRS